MNSEQIYQLLHNEIKRQKRRFARTNRNKRQAPRVRRQKRQDATTKENVGKVDFHLYNTN
jgi:hypothetical protein